MKSKTTLMITATPIEMMMGRLMKAPDHDASNGGAPAADTGQASGTPEKTEGLSTEKALEAEFDNFEDADGGTAASPDEADGDEDDEDDDEDADSEAGDDGEEEESEEADADLKPKKKNRAQERIDELTNESRSKEREAQLLREEVKRLGGDPDRIGREDDAIPEEPDPSKYQYGEQDVDYIRERAKYDTVMEMREKQAQASFKAQAAELDAKWTKNQAAALDRLPDFDEVVVKGAAENKWPCPPVIAVGIKDSDVGPDIAYHLASNPEEAKRLAELTPLEQAREFGRIEERLISKAARDARRAERQPNRVTKAPTPPKRQTRGTGAPPKKANYDTDDFRAFERAVDSKKLIRS